MAPCSLPTLSATLLIFQLLSFTAIPSVARPIPRASMMRHSISHSNLVARSTTCTVHVALTLSQTSNTVSTISLYSWVQDDGAHNLAASSMSPSAPYGNVVWDASAKKGSGSVSYQGYLDQSMQVEYYESGREHGKDQVKVWYGRGALGDGCDWGSWKGYKEAALQSYQTRHASCSFAC